MGIFREQQKTSRLLQIMGLSAFSFLVAISPRCLRALKPSFFRGFWCL